VIEVSETTTRTPASIMPATASGLSRPLICGVTASAHEKSGHRPGGGQRAVVEHLGLGVGARHRSMLVWVQV
jgi:hypothetical protein